jgi:hypothetical protein
MTPMREALQFALNAVDGEYTKEQLKEVFEGLISAEQEEIELAWIDGNRVGWAMESDWPEHGTLYFKERFKLPH